MSKAPEKTIKVEVDQHGFKGSVELLVRPYVERLKMAQKFSKGDDIDAAELMELVSKQVVSIKLTFAETKEEFDNLDEISYYAEGALLINDLSKIVLEGPKLGKS